MGKSFVLAVIILAGINSFAVAQSKHKGSKTQTASAKVAEPKQENQFVTVDEFVHAKRSAGTVVSVEGYGAVAFKGESGATVKLVDSVDHVLSASDADKWGKAGATCNVSSSGHPTWALTPKGLLKVMMYTGSTHATKVIHDAPAKIRLTGLIGKTGVIQKVTRIEYQNDNGDYVNL